MIAAHCGRGHCFAAELVTPNDNPPRDDAARWNRGDTVPRTGDEHEYVVDNQELTITGA